MERRSISKRSQILVRQGVGIMRVGGGDVGAAEKISMTAPARARGGGAPIHERRPRDRASQARVYAGPVQFIRTDSDWRGVLGIDLQHREHMQDPKPGGLEGAARDAGGPRKRSAPS